MAIGEIGRKECAPNMSAQEWQDSPVKERALLRAAYFCDVVHVHEQGGPNRGPEIDAWARQVGASLGSPWCGIFVGNNFEDSGAKDLPSNRAWSHAWVNWARATGRLIKKPTRGDVFVLLFSSTTGHVGHVVKGGASGFTTIEGNTNDEGSREGYEVARRLRSYSAKDLYFINMS